MIGLVLGRQCQCRETAFCQWGRTPWKPEIVPWMDGGSAAISFAFGVFVSGEQFYDRVEIRADLLRYIRNRQNVLLYGPRRYGKSSLASDVAGELRREGRVCIWFDLMKVNSLDHFVREYAKAAYAVASRTERNLQKALDFFRALRPKVSIGADGEATFGIDLAPGGVCPETVSI